MSKTFFRGVLSSLLLVSFTTFVTGCYVTRGFVPPGAEHFPKPPQTFETLPAAAHLKLKLTHAWEGGPLEEGWALNRRIKDVQKISGEVFQSSGFFNRVGYGIENPDFHVELKVDELEKGSPSAAMLCGMTLMLVPVATGAFFSVKATAKDRTGKVIGEYQSKGDFNATLQLLLLLFPFGWRLGIPNDVYKAIFKDILVQMNLDRAKFEMSLR